MAFRVETTPELAFKVHPELLDWIGWASLGQRVNVFSILTDEATAEAVELLLPSKLRNHTETVTAIESAPESPFDVVQQNFIDELMHWVTNRQSFPLSPVDQLLLGAEPETSGFASKHVE